MKQELKSLKEKAFTEIISNHNFELSDTTINDIIQCFPNSKGKAKVILNSLMIIKDIWDKAWPTDSSFMDITDRLIAYIEDRLPKDELKDFINKKQTYIQNRIAEGKFQSGYAGMALIRAATEIVNEDYSMKDETDPDRWSSLYIGSLSYNEGAENLEKINPEKNKIFWLNFLEVLDKNEILISNIGNKKPKKDIDIIRRNQEELWKNKESIVSKLDSLVDGYSSKLLNDDYDNLRIEAYILNNGVSFLGYYEKEKIDNKKLFFLNKEIKAKEVFLKIRQEMYDLEPKEGAWFQICLIINKNQQKNIKFFYDKYFNFFDTWRDKTDFYEDLLLYPREEKYIPNWLNDILIYNKSKR